MSILVDKNLEFDMQALGKTIKAIRIRHKLTQSEFAQKLTQLAGTEVARQKISRWEDGKNDPSAREVVAIARFADCSVDELLGLGVVTPPSSGTVDAELIERIAQATAVRVAKELQRQPASQNIYEVSSPKKDINNADLYQQMHLGIEMSNEWGSERVLRRVQALIKASLEKRGLVGRPGQAAEGAGIDPATFDRAALRAFESGSVARMQGTVMTEGLEAAIAAICYEVMGGWNSSHYPQRLGESTYKGRPEQLLRDLLNHQTT